MAGLVYGRSLRLSVRALFLIWGLVAVAIGLASVVGLARALLVGALLLLGLVLLVGASVRYVNRRKSPAVRFTTADVSDIESVIESTRVRLAAGDRAGFALTPASDPSGDAIGQIWLCADGEGRLGQVSVELALPDSVLEPAGQASLATLISSGWRIESAQPGEWVLMTRRDLVDAVGLVVPVVEGVSSLFDIPNGSTWTGRAVA